MFHTLHVCPLQLLDIPGMSDYFVSYLTGKAGEDRDVIEWKHGGSSDPEERAVQTLTKRDLPQHRFAHNPHQIVFEDHHYHEDIEPGKS